MVNVDLQNLCDKQLVLKHKIELQSNEKYDDYIEDGNSPGYSRFEWKCKQIVKRIERAQRCQFRYEYKRFRHHEAQHRRKAYHMY